MNDHSTEMIVHSHFSDLCRFDQGVNNRITRLYFFEKYTLLNWKLKKVKLL